MPPPVSQPAQTRSGLRPAWLAAFAALLLFAVAATSSLLVSEWKGPQRALTGVADLDMDGDLDVVVGHTRWEAEDISWAGVGLWINQGGGLFVLSEQMLPAGFAAAAGDLDGDGDADLAVMDGYRLAFALQQGSPAGRFTAGSPVRPARRWIGHVDMGGSVALGDLNGDGRTDGLVTACCYGTGEDPLSAASHVPSAHWLWLNSWLPDGSQVRRTLDVPALEGLPVRDAALGDLDADGDLDIFAAVGAPTIGASSGLADRVLLNDGDGRFSAASAGIGGSDSRAVALGDLNGDGRLDALVGTDGGALVWLNLGPAPDGQGLVFAPAPQVIRGGQIRSVFLQDLDGDADLDALIGEARQARIWWNMGQAEFLPAGQIFRHAARQGLAVADFDGDGLADIFAASDSGDYRLWLNQGLAAFRQVTRP